MMRFLKSILLINSKPDMTREAVYMLKRDFDQLRTRVSLLEEENKKSAMIVSEMSSCIQNLAGIISDLSADVNTLGFFIKGQIEEQVDSATKGQIFTDLSDDDDYLN